MGPNRRAQERERAAAEAAAKAKRAEAETQGNRRGAEDRRHLERAAGWGAGAVVLSDNRGSYCDWAAVVDILLPGPRAVRLSRPAHP